jgi:hypothetical protein
MSRAFSSYGQREDCIEVLVGKLEENTPLEDVDAVGKIILKLILRN